MANQNLSQFGEKLFVADADHTFIWDTAASISKRVSRNSWLNSGTLTSDAPVTISQTWAGTGSTVFKAFVVNATTPGTTSSSSSLLLDLQVGGVTQANVSKSGNLTVTGNLAANGGNSFLSGTTLRIGNSNGDINLSGGSLVIPAATAFGWANTLLVRDGADNTLALRNGETNQKFHVYATYSNASNYRRCVLGSFDGANFDIQTEGLGTGAAGGALNFGTAGVRRMAITTAGNVGIGTTAPGAKLTVITPFNNYPTDVNPVLSLRQSTDNTYGFDWIQDGSATGNLNLHRVNNAVSTHVLTVSRTTGNVGIGTTSPTSKLHVAGNSSPTITVENTLATGYSQFLFKNTAVTGDGFWLNGSAQSGYGGPSSFNLFASSGPMAFHTTSVTNALSIAQSGVATFSTSVVVNSAIRTGFINNIGDSISMFSFVNDTTGTSTYALGGSAPLMRFGGITTSFPAIKRSATTLQIRLANDSDFAPIQGKLTTETAFTATTVTPTGFITLYDSTGAAHKVPCVPV